MNRLAGDIFNAYPHFQWEGGNFDTAFNRNSSSGPSTHLPPFNGNTQFADNTPMQVNTAPYRVGNVKLDTRDTKARNRRERNPSVKLT